MRVSTLKVAGYLENQQQLGCEAPGSLYCISTLTRDRFNPFPLAAMLCMVGAAGMSVNISCIMASQSCMKAHMESPFVGAGFAASASGRPVTERKYTYLEGM